jgi:hypothetical protein
LVIISCRRVFASPNQKEKNKAEKKVSSHLAQHEADSLPGDAALGVQVVQVVHDELRRSVEVRPVKLVGDVPAKRAEFATFLFNDLVNLFKYVP